MIVRLLFLLMFLVSCGGGGGGGGGGSNNSGQDFPDPSERISSAPTLIGYGVMNYWHRIDPVHLADLLKSNGLTLTGIEYIPWFEDGPCGCKLDGGCSSRPFPDEAEHFISVMRSRGITTLVNIVNWNHCLIRKLGDQWLHDRIAEVQRLGSDRVVIGAISEPWVADPSKAERWTRLIKSALPGPFVMPSPGTSRKPMWNIPHDFVDVHYCKDGALIDGLRSGDQRLLASTDCSPIINPGPDRAAKFTREALATNVKLLIYGFREQQPDETVIGAMGNEIRVWAQSQ